MPSVDNRIVEMRFDNKDFESGVSTSLSTLDKLKKSLNLKDASKGFDELDKAAGKVSFSPLMNAAEAVTNKFSALGVIGDQVLRRIGDEVANLEFKVVSLVKSMSVDQISAGWTKYEQKTADVQAIMNATGLSLEAVNAQLDRLMWYSDETSFGFTDMTTALKTMTSVGGNIEDLIPMMYGVGNAVAFAGKGASDFSHIMQYSISQAYSKGYMLYGDWKTLEGYGIASEQLKTSFLSVAEAMGKIKEGEYDLSTFRDFMSDYKLDAEVMEKGFAAFAEMTVKAEELINAGVYENATEAYAALADDFDEIARNAALSAQQAKSFGETIDAVKDAVSTGWMRSFELLFGDYREATELWTWAVEELLDVFASGAEGRNQMLEQWHDGIEVVDDQYKDLIDTIWASDSALAESMLKSGQFTKTLSGYELAIESLHNVWDGLKNILYAVKDAWSSVLPALDAPALIRMTERVRDATAAFRDMFGYVEEKTETVKKLFGGTKEGAEEAAEAIETTSSALDDLAYAVIQGNYGNGQARFDAIAALGYSWQEVQNRVNELLGSSYRYETAAEDTIAVTEEESEAMESLGESTSSVAEATEEMTEEMGESTPAILAIQGAVRGIAGAVSILKQAAKAAWKVVVKPALTAALKALKPAFLWVSKIGNKIGEIAQEWEKTGKIEAFLTKVVDVFNRITAPLKQFASKVSEIFSKVKQSDAFTGFVDNLNNVWEALKRLGGKVGEKVLGLFDKLNIEMGEGTWAEAIVGAVEKALNWINSFLDKVDFDSLVDYISEKWSRIKDFFSSIDFSSFDSFANKVKELLSGILTDSSVRDDVKTWVINVWNGAITGLKELNLRGFGAAFVSKIKDSFSGLGGGLTWYEVLFSGFSIGKLLKDIGKTGIFLGISKFFYGLGSIFTSSAYVVKQFGGVLKGVQSSLRGFTNLLNATALLEIAIAIGVLAGSMWVLSTIPQEKLYGTAIALVAVMLGLAGLLKIIGQLRGSGIQSSMKELGSINFNLLPSTAAIILAIGISIGLLVKAFKELVELLNGDGSAQIANATRYLVGFFIAIVGFSYLLSRYGGDVSIGTAASIIALAGAVYIIVAAFERLTAVLNSGISTGSKVLAGAVIVAILGALVGIVAIGKKVQASSMLGIGAMFVLIAAGINLLVPALTALTLLDSDKLGEAALAIGILLIAFGGMAALAGRAESAKKVFASLMGIAIVVGVLGAVLSALSGSTWADLGPALAVIGILVAGIVLLGGIVGTIPGIAKGLTVLGNAFLKLGIGVALIGVMVMLFAKFAKGFSEGLKTILEGLADMQPQLLSAINLLIFTIADAIAGSVTLIASAMFAVIIGLGNALVHYLPTLLTILSKILVIVVVWLVKQIPWLVDALVKAVIILINSLSIALIQNGAAIGKAIGTFIKVLLFFVVEAIAGVLDGFFGLNIGDKIKEALGVDDIVASLEEDNAALTGALGTSGSSLIGAMEEFSNDITASGDTISGAFTDAAGKIYASKDEYYESLIYTPGSVRSPEEVSTGTPDNPGEYMLGLIQEWNASGEFGFTVDATGTIVIHPEIEVEGVSSEDVQAAMTADWESRYPRGAGSIGPIIPIEGSTVIDIDASVASASVSEDLGQVESAVEAGTAGILSAITDGSGDISIAIADLVDFDSIDYSSLFDDGDTKGSGFPDGLVSGLESGTDSVYDATALLGDSVISGYSNATGTNSPSTVAMELGGYFDEGLAIGITQKQSTVKSRMQLLVNSVLTIVRSARDRFYTAGSYIVQGFANGMTNSTALAESAARAVVRSAIVAGEEEAGIQSPSKEFARLGEYSTMGYAQGMTKTSGIAEEASRSMVLSSINSAKNTLSLLASAIDSDVDMDPTIRPVLDLSNVRAGAAQANALMNQTYSMRLGYSMAAMAGGEVQGARNTAINAQRERTSNYNSNFRELRADIHELKEAMSEMKMVLDTGEVVGAIQRPMDSALGRNVRFATRRL